MLKIFLRVGLVVALAGFSAAPSLAQGIEFGPGGVRVLPDDRRDDRGPPRRDRYDISEREAARIARSEGMREIDDVFRQRRSFRVEGADRRGRALTVIVDRRTGEVLDIR